MCRLGKAILRCRVPTAMRQLSKVKALVETGVGRSQVIEQLGISEASYDRCLSGYLSLLWLVIVLCQPFNRIDFS